MDSTKTLANTDIILSWKLLKMQHVYCVIDSWAACCVQGQTWKILQIKCIENPETSSLWPFPTHEHHPSCVLPISGAKRAFEWFCSESDSIQWRYCHTFCSWPILSLGNNVGGDLDSDWSFTLAVQHWTASPSCAKWPCKSYLPQFPYWYTLERCLQQRNNSFTYVLVSNPSQREWHL